MSDRVAIERVRQVWTSMVRDFPTATKKFEAARKIATAEYDYRCELVTADEFFKYLKEYKQYKRMHNRNWRHAIDLNGDFDDMGMSATAGAYHYQQKKARGRL